MSDNKVGMETREFKRASYLVLQPKLTKAGLAGVAKKRKDINLVGEILAIQSAGGKLIRDLEPYISPGVQLNDILRAKAKENLGELLQHTVTAAKILKVKTPASQKKIKARTQTLLLMEITRYVGEVFDTFVSAVQGAKVVPMTDEEKAAAQKKYDEAEVKRKAKFDALPATSKKTVKVKKEDGTEVEQEQDVPKGEYKPGTPPTFTKIVPASLNEAALQGQIEHLLKLSYEFNWSMLDRPVAETMEQRIERVKALHTEIDFTPPPKKEGKAPPRKKEKTDAAAVVAAQENKAPAQEAAKA